MRRINTRTPEGLPRTIFVLCSSASTGLGWPDAAHLDLGSAQAAAEAAARHPLRWIPDPGDASTWNTLFPDDWMIREVELNAELSVQ
jgi:hypothetical protein